VSTSWKERWTQRRTRNAFPLSTAARALIRFILSFLPSRLQSRGKENEPNEALTLAFTPLLKHRPKEAVITLLHLAASSVEE